MLNVTAIPGSGNTNLTSDGNIDWVHFGYPKDATAVHMKNGLSGAHISPISIIGADAPIAAVTPGKTFTWSDAIPTKAIDITQPSDPVVIVNGQNDGDANGGPPPGAETEIHVFDDDTQKYLNFLDLNSGVIVTPGIGATTLKGIRFYTANDAVERDPASYVLEGSNNGGTTWAGISSGPLALPDGRNLSGHAPDPAKDFNQTILFTSSSSYSSYRVTFPTLKDAGAAVAMQIGEIELLAPSPNDTANNTSDAIALTGNGDGFHFSVVAGPFLRHLKIYVGVDGGGTGTLSASLSDGSVAPQNVPMNDTNAAGATLAQFSIDYQSILDNQILNIDWIGSRNAKLILSAVSWSGPSTLVVAPSTPISGDTNLTTEGNLDWIHIGYPSDPAQIHRKGGVSDPKLSTISTIGAAAATSVATTGKTFSWNDAIQTIVGDITTSSDPVTIVNGTDDGDGFSGVPPAAETEIHAFDNDTQKYLNPQDLNSGIIVTPAANGGKGTIVTGIRFYTANDSVERDPASYTIEGSNDGGTTWQSMAGGALALPDGRNAGGHVPNAASDFNQLVTFSNNTSYKSYRIRFPTLKDAAAANSMQIGEIELLALNAGDSATATPSAAAVTGAGNGFHLTAPASPLLRRVKVYVGVDGNGTGTLTATMSDGTMVPVIQTLTDTKANGPTLAVYTISYRSTVDQQTLSIDWVASSGTAIISAATWGELSPPTPAVGINAVASGQGKVNVSWIDTSTNEKGFIIERAPSINGVAGAYSNAGTVDANVTQFLDTGLTPGSDYFYRVNSQNLAGVGFSPDYLGFVTTRSASATGLFATFWNDPSDGGAPPKAKAHLGALGDKPVFTQLQSNINVNWSNGSPDSSVGTLISGSRDLFSSQWDGKYIADYTGPASFFTDTDDGGRFFIDLDQNGTFDYNAAAAGTNTPSGELVVNSWSDQGLGMDGPNNGRGVVVDLVAGQTYSIRFQHYEHSGGAAAYLYVQGPVPGATPTIIPTENLVPPDILPPRMIGAPEIDQSLPVTAPYTALEHVVIHFSKPIGGVPDGAASLIGDDGLVYNAHWAFDLASLSAVLTFDDQANATLPDQNYRLNLIASKITDLTGQPLDANADGTGGDDYLTPAGQSFYFLTGDTQHRADGTYNGDRRVDFIDLQRIEANFGKTILNRPAASDGDVNHDGKVDRLDLGIILANQGHWLAAPAVNSAPALATRPIVRPTSVSRLTPLAAAPFSSKRVQPIKDWLKEV